jgi:hypothetical protein
MSYDYRISIKELENGYEIEVPDFEEIAKKQAAQKKNSSGDTPSIYTGDCTKCFAAKSVKEVLALVKTSLEKMPDTADGQYAKAFEEASGLNSKT